MSDFLWVEKYRPKTIEECILPSETKKTFLGFLSKGGSSKFTSFRPCWLWVKPQLQKHCVKN